jgi:iron-sulfur cluster repair protein YtfE (RIC family)
MVTSKNAKGENTMATLTQPLRDEHKELFPHIESLRLAGDLIDETFNTSARAGVKEAHSFLIHHLIPHAQAEDKALYPVVQKAMGASQVTATMSRDHVEVGRLTEELAGLQAQITGPSITSEHARALRRVLYGLYALVKVHFAKEEEIYLSLLDSRLTPEQAHAMFEAMEAAAHEAKDLHGHAHQPHPGRSQ